MQCTTPKVAFVCFCLSFIPSISLGSTLVPGDEVNARFTSLSSHVNHIDLLLDGSTYGDGSEYDHNVGSGGCWAGIHCWDIEDVASSYKSFCGDMTVDPAFSTRSHTVSDYTGDIESVWGTYYDLLFDGQDDALQAAALQLAIWEISHETTGNYDISSGAFQLTGVEDNNGANLANLTALTNTYLDSNNWTGTTDLLQLTADGYQPLFYPNSTVPEPATWTLLAFLVLGGLTLRSRKK